ncbi:MAG: 30S ribosomal protein S20 [Alphaproteobacteria bacterium]|nr:30S ribosomal protein S20 [Alphaproteobacteria bacterium]
MANHKSAKKRILVTATKNACNTRKKTATKTAIKKAEKALAGTDKAAAVTAVRAAESKIMKNKTMPKKRAARKISRMTKKLSK